MNEQELIDRLKLLRKNTNLADIWFQQPKEHRSEEQGLEWLRIHQLAIDCLIKALE